MELQLEQTQGTNELSNGTHKGGSLRMKVTDVLTVHPEIESLGIHLPECWQHAASVVNTVRTTLLYGPPGTGKTTAGNISESEVFNLTLHPESGFADLLGHYVLRGQDTVWHDGPAISAWRKGGRLVLNEVNLAGLDALTSLYALLDDPGIAGVVLPSGEYVRPADGFSCVATMNGLPDELDDPLRDRFQATILISEPHPNALLKVMESWRLLAWNWMQSEEAKQSKVTMRRFIAASIMVSAGISLDVAAKCAGLPGDIQELLATAIVVPQAPAETQPDLVIEEIQKSSGLPDDELEALISELKGGA